MYLLNLKLQGRRRKICFGFRKLRRKRVNLWENKMGPIKLQIEIEKIGPSLRGPVSILESLEELE